MKKLALRTLITAQLCLHLETAAGVEFEKLNTAIAKALKTTKAFKTNATVKGEATAVFYSKNAAGRPQNFAVVQKGLYRPNCTHTWVVALNAAAKVEDVRVVEMSCNHAFPAKQPSYLSQFKGKGPAQMREIASGVEAIAKATGTCDLTRDAVVKSIQAVASLHGKI